MFTWQQLGIYLAAAGCLSGAVLGLSGQRDVMVQVLTPGHQQVRHRVVVDPFVLHVTDNKEVRDKEEVGDNEDVGDHERLGGTMRKLDLLAELTFKNQGLFKGVKKCCAVRQGTKKSMDE